MNTIKLKAFNENEKKIVDVKQITFFEDGDIIVTYEVYSGEERNMRNPKILRYVGAKDIKGVEIYEGYIVRYADSIGTVIYNQFCACFDFRRLGGDCEALFSYGGEPYEVIGNIYENPELLYK